MLQRLTGGRTSTGSVGLGATRRAHTLSRISLGPHFSVLSGVRNPPLLPPCRCLSFAPANRGSHTPSRTFFLPDRARRWTGMMGAAGLLALLLGSWCLVAAQELPATGLNGYSLHPPYFNLAEGTKITATATCGEDEAGRSLQDLYCKLVGGPVSGDPSQTIQGQYCDICSQEDSDRAHPITNAIDGTERWWQSPPLSRSTEYNEVNVTLDLGQACCRHMFAQEEGFLPSSCLIWTFYSILCRSEFNGPGSEPHCSGNGTCPDQQTFLDQNNLCVSFSPAFR